jgi:hypothetical protein
MLSERQALSTSLQFQYHNEYMNCDKEGRRDRTLLPIKDRQSDAHKVSYGAVFSH